MTDTDQQKLMDRVVSVTYPKPDHFWYAPCSYWEIVVDGYTVIMEVGKEVIEFEVPGESDHYGCDHPGTLDFDAAKLRLIADIHDRLNAWYEAATDD